MIVKMVRQKISSVIKILPDFIANQIAAGEVVQRPESVVKELMENSLDAGADEIAVLVKDAGKKLIHIIDNGNGMTSDDLKLSIKRHATSKIYDQEQLDAILTYGFRGEALASIASVAKLEIRTKRAEEPVGLSLISNPGKEEIVEPCNTDNGTQIFVRSLFFNTPARRKFLRSNITEFRHISETMIKFALANTDKRFTFYDDNNKIFDAKPESLTTRLENLMGENIKDNLIPVEFVDGDIEIRGFVGTPSLSDKKPYGDYFYLNKRPIKSRSLAHAVFSAYEHLLDKQQKPFYVLFLTVDPRTIDINVHPQKHEVKFENERAIYNIVLKAVSSALGKFNLFPMGDEAVEIKNPFERVGTGDDEVVVNKMTGEIIYEKSGGGGQNFSGGQFGGGQFSGGNFQNRNFDSRKFEPHSNDISAYERLFEDLNESSNDLFERSPKEIISDEIRNYYKMGEGVYQVAYEEMIFYVDAINSHQRILYERAINSQQKTIPSQELLFPVEIEGSSIVEKADNLQQVLTNMGYDYTTEDNKLILKAVPALEGSHTGADGITKILGSDEIIAGGINIELIAKRFAEANSFRRNDNIKQEELIALLEQLLKCKNPKISPSGKKTYQIVEKKMILNQFK